MEVPPPKVKKKTALCCYHLYLPHIEDLVRVVRKDNNNKHKWKKENIDKWYNLRTYY